jgi:RNA polymerase sigma-70 factor (ECF subfamily)
MIGWRWLALAVVGNLDRAVNPLDDDLWTLALDRAAAAPGPTNAVRDLLWRSLHLSGWRPQVSGPDGPAATSDRALLERFVHGDPEAFEALVERHGGALVGFARRSLPNEYADDAVHEAFLALFSGAHDVLASGERSVQGFLFRSARVHVRKNLGQLLREQGEVDDLPAPAPARGHDPLAALRAREPPAAAALLLDTCDALEQELVLLRMRGHDTAEIAAILELEPEHVEAVEQRARAKLARKVERAR